MKTAWAEGSSTRLDRLRSMRSSIWLLHRGGGPEIGGFGGNLDKDCVGRGFVDHDWITFEQCENRSGCYAGAVASEQEVCVVAFVDLGRVGGGSLRLCHSFVQIVWFLDPVSLINWVNSFYLFGRWIRPLYSSKKKMSEISIHV